MKVIDRPEYVEKLKRFRDKHIIKVVTGIRRCGKSTLFDIYANALLSDGVESGRIIRLNLEDAENRAIKDCNQLYDYVNAMLCAGGMNYVFIDEVQNVEGFEKAIDWLYVKENVDLYITGSNAFILSSELGTFLSGRYVEINVLPLSFKEYVSAFEDKTDLIMKYNKYIQNGAFPFVLSLEKGVDIRAYYEGLYNSIIVKDVVKRNGVQDLEQLERVTEFMFNNIGNLVSSTSIANALTSGGRSISFHTVDSYINALVESYVLYKVKRYDVRGKEILSTGAKFYLSDVGLRFYLLGTRGVDYGHILENVVYLELKRRGYDVYVGKSEKAEVDFVAIDENGVKYFQVAFSLNGYGSNGKPIIDRELEPLRAIKDFNQKFLITMDFTPKTSHDGIVQINALEWLLGEQ